MAKSTDKQQIRAITELVAASWAKQTTDGHSDQAQPSSSQTDNSKHDFKCNTVEEYAQCLIEFNDNPDFWLEVANLLGLTFEKGRVSGNSINTDNASHHNKPSKVCLSGKGMADCYVCDSVSNDVTFEQPAFRSANVNASTVASPLPTTSGLRFFENQRHFLHGAMPKAKNNGNSDSDVDVVTVDNVRAPLLKKKPKPHVNQRNVFTQEQRDWLERTFQLDKYIGRSDRKVLASGLGLPESKVKIWFQNRRLKWRRANKKKNLQESTRKA